MATGAERRRNPRVPAGITAEIHDDKDTKLLGIGYIKNVGINCAGLETVVVLVKGQRFSLRFLLEKKYLVHVVTTVARIVPQGTRRYYGVTFDKIDLLAVEQLQQFIEQHTKESHT